LEHPVGNWSTLFEAIGPGYRCSDWVSRVARSAWKFLHKSLRKLAHLAVCS